MPPTKSRNWKIQYGRQAAILKVTSLKINRLLPMTTINMHMKFEIEIPKQTWLMLRKPCRLQTDGRTDRRTDNVNPVYPPPTSLGGGIKRQKVKYYLSQEKGKEKEGKLFYEVYMQSSVLKGNYNNGKHVSIIWLTSRMCCLANEVKRPPETLCLRDQNNWFPH